MILVMADCGNSTENGTTGIIRGSGVNETRMCPGRFSDENYGPADQCRLALLALLVLSATEYSAPCRPHVHM